jgi:hypothetical protein
MSESTNVGDRPEDHLDENHPQWCVNVQIKELLLGFGADEDSRMVIEFFREVGLPKGTAERIHHALVGAERSSTNDERRHPLPATPGGEQPAENSNPEASTEERVAGCPDAPCSLSSLSSKGGDA